VGLEVGAFTVRQIILKAYSDNQHAFIQSVFDTFDFLTRWTFDLLQSSESYA